MKIKTSILVSIVAVVIVIAGVLVYVLWPRPPYVLNIWTGGVGGVYYPLGTKLAEMLNKYAGDAIKASTATSEKR